VDKNWEGKIAQADQQFAAQKFHLIQLHHATAGEKTHFTFAHQEMCWAAGNTIFYLRKNLAPSNCIHTSLRMGSVTS
jgi:hypothetical protein